MFDLIKPTEILKKYIMNYCIVDINEFIEFLPVERVYPNGNVTLVFHYGSPSKFKKRIQTSILNPIL